MLKSKTFVKKTRSGSILKIVREHYLRDDIWCHSPVCKNCGHENPSLEEIPKSLTTVCDFPHYIIPDTNVVMHQIDVLEDPAFKNVIILQTVLEEVRHRHSPIYKRIKDLISNENRHFYSFTNEHHRETYIERQPGESANDRNDRAIRLATKWYQSHLKACLKDGSTLDVVLLTNDRQNLEKAKNDGLQSFTIHDYVQNIKDHPQIIDRLARSMETSKKLELDKERGPLFPEHLTPSQLHAGVKAGRFKKGSFMASRENYLEGFVSLDGEERMILIQGRINLNRAVHYDTVVVEIFPESDWSVVSGIVLEEALEVEKEEDDKDEKLLKQGLPANTVEKQPTGRIVGILKKGWRQYCGILLPSPIKEATKHLFVPAERRIPRIRIETRQAETLQTQRIVVTIDSWPRNSRYPQGHFIRSLGQIGNKEAENEVLLLEHDVPHQEFSQLVLSFLPKMPWLITDEDEKCRENLRHIPICSVDPPGCTDIDDALHCRLLENGKYEVGVHIADVSHFIRPGTALDDEASNRGTTVYLTDKRIDMVPDLLSSNLCSLRSDVDRFAFSCIWEMNADAEILNVKFHKSIIRSQASLTYAEAQMMIDDTSRSDELTLGLRRLNSLAKILKKRRLDNGALVLASPEIRFTVDSETHDPIDVETKQLKETNSMVEEFMLLANISVAEKIFEHFPECALLRRHPAPPVSNFDPLIKAGMSQNFTIKTDCGKDLATSLDIAQVAENLYFNTMLRILATRCMMQAVYFCSGTVTEDQFFHYGLAAPIYTHFTSPIRRYSDIIVHRLLAVIINADSTYPELVDKKKTQSVCNNLNYRHKMAQYAGRASVNLHTHLFFKDKIIDEEAYVLFVRKNALQILIPKFGLEASLFYKDKDGKNLCKLNTEYNEAEAFVSIGDKKIKLFDPVVVQISIDRSNVQHQKLVLKLVQPEIPGFSVPPLPKEPSEETGTKITPSKRSRSPSPDVLRKNQKKAKNKS